MSSESHGASVSPGTILCVLCLLLYCAGFIRIELKSTNHEERLVAVEEVISHITKRGMVDTSTKGKYCANTFLRSWRPWFSYRLCLYKLPIRFYLNSNTVRVNKLGRPKAIL